MFLDCSIDIQLPTVWRKIREEQQNRATKQGNQTKKEPKKKETKEEWYVGVSHSGEGFRKPDHRFQHTRGGCNDLFVVSGFGLVVRWFGGLW